MARSNRSPGPPLLAVVALAAACATAPPPPPPQAAERAAADPAEASDARIGELEQALADERRTAAELADENAELRQRLAEAEAARLSLAERHAALESELADAVEELLRSSGGGRGVRSRAFATSRISEVRVQLESVARADDPEVAARLEPAHDMLARADLALEEENFGGASYLAERASELIRRARIVSEIRATSDRSWGDVIPIVPPRRMRVRSNSNLRAGPAREEARVGGVAAGAEVTALARSGEWFQVETGDGLKAWILGRLVQPL